MHVFIFFLNYDYNATTISFLQITDGIIMHNYKSGLREEVIYSTKGLQNPHSLKLGTFLSQIHIFSYCMDSFFIILKLLT